MSQLGFFDNELVLHSLQCDPTHAGSFFILLSFFFLWTHHDSYWLLQSSFNAAAIAANRPKEQKEALRYCLSIMLNNHRCLVRDEALNLSHTASCFYLSLCTSVEGIKPGEKKKARCHLFIRCSEFQSRAYRIGVDLAWLCATATMQIYRHSILFCFWHTVIVSKRDVHLCANKLLGDKSFFFCFFQSCLPTVRLCQPNNVP